MDRERRRRIGKRRSEHRYKRRSATHIQLVWQRLLAFIFYIPAFFSMLTVYMAIHDQEMKAALIFTLCSLLSSICGTLLWFGKAAEVKRKVEEFFRITRRSQPDRSRASKD